MIEKIGEDLKTDTNPKHNTNPDQNINPNPNLSTEMPSIMELVSRFSPKYILSGEANEYINKLRNILEDLSAAIRLRCKRIEGFNNGVIFVNEKQEGFVVLFNRPDDDGKELLLATDLQESYNIVVNSKYKIIGLLALDQEDYLNYNQTADYILKIFKMTSNVFIDNMTIRDFSSREFSLEIDTTLSEVKNFAKLHRPKAILPRMDVGFTCSLVKNFGDRVKVKLFSVGAFTEFIPDLVVNNFTQQKPQFIALNRITDITSAIPSTTILPLALSVAAEVFNFHEVWKTPYRIIKNGKVNIGNLITDSKGKLQSVTEKDVDAFFNGLFKPAGLAIDIANNFNYLPEIPSITNGSGLKSILDKFLMTTLPIVPLANNVFTEIIGTLNIKDIVPGEDVIDSRYVDYLTLCSVLKSKNGEPPPKVASLLYRNSDAITRAAIITDICGEFLKRDIVHVSILNPEILQLMSTAISPYLNINTNLSQHSNFVNHSLLDQNLLSGSGMLKNFGRPNQTYSPFVRPF